MIEIREHGGSGTLEHKVRCGRAVPRQGTFEPLFGTRSVAPGDPLRDARSLPFLAGPIGMVSVALALFRKGGA